MSLTTDWIMVIITGIYVIATILICIFNYRSAKATREQVAEAKRQYEDTNRAFITYEFLYERKAFYGIRFTNHGKRVANNVEIQLNEGFIESIEEQNFYKILNEQKGRRFILGIGQSYDIFFGASEYRQNSNKIPIEGTLIYEDDRKSYIEPFYIDLASYATIYSVDNNADDLTNEMKKQTRELEGIKKEIRILSAKIPTKQIEE